MVFLFLQFDLGIRYYGQRARIGYPFDACPHKPRPPHLLGTQPAFIFSMPLSGMTAVTQPIAALGNKGLFLRSRSIILDPSEAARPESPMTGLSWKRVSVPQLEDARRGGHQSLVDEASSDRRRGKAGQREKVRSRPSSPDQARRYTRFGPSILPAIQKGEDGRWQPPSLPRGSVSMSALALYAEEETRSRPNTYTKDSQAADRKKGHKHSLSLFFVSSRFRGKNPSEVQKGEPGFPGGGRLRRGEGRGERKIEEGTAKSPTTMTWQAISPPRPPTVNQITSSKNFKAATTELHSELKYYSPDRPRTPLRPPTSKQHLSSTPFKPASPNSRLVSFCSRDRDILRLSTSVIVRSLTPVIRGSGFVQDDENVEMHRLVEQRLSALRTMEQGWDDDSVRISGEDLAVSHDPVTGSLETKVRSVNVGERVEEREGQRWIEALQDGVLLCL